MSLASLKKLLLGQRGFTAVEMVVAAGLMGLVASAAGPATYHAFSAITAAQEVIATQSWSNSADWYARDVTGAQQTDLVQGSPPAPTVSLTWMDTDGIQHTSNYALVGDDLVRTYDGASHTVARHVVSAAFSRTENIITADLQVGDNEGAPRAVYLTALMRASGAARL